MFNGASNQLAGSFSSEVCQRQARDHDIGFFAGKIFSDVFGAVNDHADSGRADGYVDSARQFGVYLESQKF